MSTKLLNVPIQRQKEGYCGPQALAAVLHYYGDHISVDALARLCKTTSTEGTEPENLVGATKSRGFRAQTKLWAEIKDLESAVRRKRPPIVLWFSETEGHYSVVVGLNRREVFLADPELGAVRTFPRNVFRRLWFDFSTDGPEKHSRLYARWMMTVEPQR